MSLRKKKQQKNQQSINQIPDLHYPFHLHLLGTKLYAYDIHNELINDDNINETSPPTSPEQPLPTPPVKNNDVMIFFAEHKQERIKLAIKKILIDNKNDDELEIIKDHILLVRNFMHRNILPFLSVFVEDESLWIVTPLCYYGSADQISKPVGLCEYTISFIARDILSALCYIHERDVVHRAIKGEHILIYGARGCMLTGFEFSTRLKRRKPPQESVSHDFPDIPKAEKNLNWLAPEILEQNLLGYGVKSDIYSLGVTCCELANGVIPFKDSTATEMLLDKLTGNFPKPIDRMCNEILATKTDNLDEEVKIRYAAYQEKLFSYCFHSFCVDFCLASDPQRRAHANELLAHPFVTRLDKEVPSNFLNLLKMGNVSPMYGQ